MQMEKWVLCPICENKTRIKIRQDTILENFPLFCPKCKKETIISVKEMNIAVMNTITTKEKQQVSYQRARRTDAEPITHTFNRSMDYRLLLFDNFILSMRLLTDRNNKTVVSAILHLKKAAVLYLNQAAVSLRLSQTNDDLLTEHGGI